MNLTLNLTWSSALGSTYSNLRPNPDLLTDPERGPVRVPDHLARHLTLSTGLDQHHLPPAPREALTDRHHPYWAYALTLYLITTYGVCHSDTRMQDWQLDLLVDVTLEQL